MSDRDNDRARADGQAAHGKGVCPHGSVVSGQPVSAIIVGVCCVALIAVQHGLQLGVERGRGVVAGSVGKGRRTVGCRGEQPAALLQHHAQRAAHGHARRHRRGALRHRMQEHPNKMTILTKWTMIRVDKNDTPPESSRPS